MDLNNFLVDWVFDTLRGVDLPTNPNIRIKLFNDLEQDITSTLLDVEYITVAPSSWTVSNLTVSNNTLLELGTVQGTYSGSIELRLYTESNQEIASLTNPSVYLLDNTVFTIASGNLAITLTNIAIPLGNYLLNALFKNNRSGKPTTWYAQLVTTTGSNAGSRVFLPQFGFTPTYTNELGDPQIHYAGFNPVTVPEDSKINRIRLFTTSSGGTAWFETSITPSYKNRSDTVFEIYSNTIKFSSRDFQPFAILPRDSSVRFYVNFDGDTYNYATSGKLIETNIQSYNSQLNLFNGECAVFDSGVSASFSGVNFPKFFTLDFYVYFSTDPLGRLISLFNKNSAISLIKTAANRYQVTINGQVLIDVPFTYLPATWEHLYIARTTDNQLILKASAINTTVSVSNALAVNTNSNPLVIGGNIQGLCNGLILREGNHTYFNNQIPVKGKPYRWDIIDRNVWTNLSFTQWKQYFN